MSISSTFLGIFGLWPSAMLVGGPVPSAPVVKAKIDHILLGVADLEQGIQRLTAATGIRPTYGGKHPRGTHNALLSLGDHTYLELIAVQPGVVAPEDMAALAGFNEPAPIGWAVSGSDVASLRLALEHARFSLSAPDAGSRTTPSGATLHWQTFELAHELQGAPFFIVWSAGTPHPSTTSPSGCKLGQFLAMTPDAAQLQPLQSALGLPVQLTQAKKAAFSLSLDCPKGPVTFKTP